MNNKIQVQGRYQTKIVIIEQGIPMNMVEVIGDFQFIE